MNSKIKAVAVCMLGASFMGACATQHSVKRLDRKLGVEVSQRMAGDSAAMSEIASVRNDVTQLRTELGNLRTEFGARITAMEEGIRFAFPVNFAFDDATVRPEDQAQLDRFAAVAAKYYPGSKITVEGFADPAGTNRYNLGLSKRRAESVRSYLVSKGLSDANLMTVGYGEARQVVRGAERDEPGAEQNRRVVFVIETKSDSTAAAVTASALQGAQQ
ncbi:MAG: OmpA family protein [Gemmatimonadaceae bacterium]